MGHLSPIAFLVSMAASVGHAQGGEQPMRPEIRVGVTEGDLTGRDQRVLQAAVDYVAGLGGGTVRLGAGEWTLRDSVRLRSGVRLIGSGPETVLSKAPGGLSLLAEDGDYGDVRALPAQPDGFEAGDGVTVRSKTQGGFHSTVATVIRKDPDGALILDGIFNSDFMVAQEASVSRACPLIRAVDIAGVEVRDLTIDGNRPNCPLEDSCRGGGINFLRVANVQIANVTIRDMNGDGLSYQNCPDVTVEDCTFEGNAGGGCHPGSGSARPIVRNCTMRNNGGCGIFVCWRVKNGLFEDNVIEDNGQLGVSIGHKDTDNIIRRNQIRRNAQGGIYFRNEPDYSAAHRCTVEECTIEDNGSAGEYSGQPPAGIRVDGHTDGIALRRNRIRDTRAEGKTQAYGILINADAGPVTLEGNETEGNTKGDVLDLRP